MIHRLLRQQTVSSSLDEVWAYFSTPHNLNEMTPLDMKFETLHGGDEKMFEGQLIEYRVSFMPLIKSHWLTEIAHVEEKAYFVDEQRIGPYCFWYHEHRFVTVKGDTQITDHRSNYL
jgi:ligand-binding SRPBCC domain-containing protein